ncbi:hypothetical protein GGI23_004033 [Coemansia sp. RSA 2559]|nr:hypothetical protein GGI23_004033 [Coemansia sp. RSA 2559]KAJ2854879.1 hypothetical protein GGI22_004335 [Coemansia erecta]
MDKFIESVQSQDIPLDGIDELISSKNISCYYCFENTSPVKSWGAFMPPDILCSSFYKALHDFPILSGRFKVDNLSRGYVEVDRNNLNMPVYTDADWDVEFKNLMDMGFKSNLLPDNFDDFCGIAAASRFGTVSAKLGVFHVRRLKNYSGVVVFASISHAVVDGYAYLAFMRRWAEISKWMQENPTINESTLLTATFSHDRSIHSEYRLDGTDALNSTLLKTINDSNAITRFFSSLPIDKRNSIFKAMVTSVPLSCCSFHVSIQALKAFQNSVQEYAPPGTWYSTNDVLTALLTIVIGQATYDVSDRKHNTFVSKVRRALFGDGSNKPRDILAAVVINARSRVNHPRIKDFMGNLSITRSVLCPHELVQGKNYLESLSKIATELRNILLATDEKFVGQFNFLMNSESDMFMRVVLKYRKQNSITVSNVSKTGYYEIDFGAGIPCLVRPIFRATPNLISVMPCHPDIGGYDVLAHLDRDVAKIVAQDKRWMGLVDSHYLDI